MKKAGRDALFEVRAKETSMSMHTPMSRSPGEPEDSKKKEPMVVIGSTAGTYEMTARVKR